MKAVNKFAASLVLAGAAIWGSNAPANELNGQEIKAKISGKTVYLATKWGIEFPLSYSQVTVPARGLVNTLHRRKLAIGGFRIIRCASSFRLGMMDGLFVFVWRKADRALSSGNAMTGRKAQHVLDRKRKNSH